MALQSYIDAYLDTLRHARERDLRELVARNANLDEVFRDELATALGIYSTLEEHEKQVIRDEARNITLRETLAHIADLNPELFDAIERMHAEGVPVVAWLRRQVRRARVIPRAFDEEIAARCARGGNGRPAPKT